MENLRVLEGSEVFFRGLQHPDSPVQIRSAPLGEDTLSIRRWRFGVLLFLEYSENGEQRGQSLLTGGQSPLHPFHQIKRRLRRIYSHPVMENALNSVVSMTTLDVRVPSCPIFRAIT